MDFQLSSYLNLLFDGVNRRNHNLSIPSYPIYVVIPFPLSFTPHVIKQETVVVWKSKNFSNFNIPQITRTIATKKGGLEVSLVTRDNKTLEWCLRVFQKR